MHGYFTLPAVVSASRDANLAHLTDGKIVGHISPDWDCITGLYFCAIMMPGTDIVLVPAGTPAAAMPRAVAIVDVGGQHDDGRWHFDHHQNPGNTTSAAKLAMVSMENRGLYVSPTQQDWVRTVTAADLGRSSDGAAESRRAGLHGLLSLWKGDRLSDEEIMCRGLAICWAMFINTTPAMICAAFAADMQRWAAICAEAQEEYTNGLVYRSDDGKVQALANAGPLATQEAYARGATLVAFHNAETGVVGITRQGEATSPHVGNLVASLAGDAAAETADWFRHPAGFFAGLSPKAGNTRPLGMALEALAAAVDAAWTR